MSATKGADDALCRIIERINDGFSAGKVSRMQALSWLILYNEQNLSDSVILQIRADHYDEITMLEAILRQAKTAGKLPQELRGFLHKQMGLEETMKKKSKKQFD
jgi:hypothetical protein